MKKRIIMFLAGVLCLSLAACAAEEAAQTTEPQTQPTYKQVDWNANNGLSSSGGCAMEDTIVE